jgi:hypothetical protein
MIRANGITLWSIHLPSMHGLSPVVHVLISTRLFGVETCWRGFWPWRLSTSLSKTIVIHPMMSSYYLHVNDAE